MIPLLYPAVFVGTVVTALWTFIAVSERGAWQRVLKALRRRFS